MAKQKTEQWDSASYFQRKAARQQAIRPQWITDEITGERFLVRNLGRLQSRLVAGATERLLKDESLEAWQEAGLEMPEVDSTTEQAQPETKDANSVLAMTGRTVMQACVIPKIVLGNPKAGEIRLTDLEDSELRTIFRAAIGLNDTGEIALQGGGSTTVKDTKSVSGKPGKRSGTVARG